MIACNRNKRAATDFIADSNHAPADGTAWRSTPRAGVVSDGYVFCHHGWRSRSPFRAPWAFGDGGAHGRAPLSLPLFGAGLVDTKAG
jgi:hypothetical protein